MATNNNDKKNTFVEGIKRGAGCAIYQYWQQLQQSWSQVEINQRISECKDMEEYNTSLSLKATIEGDIVRAKEHARKAQAYRQELEKLSQSAYKA